MTTVKHSAGILLYRYQQGTLQVLLVHPGGPFWAKKDLGAWFVPKGELEPNEDALTAAKREFQEELGSPAPSGEYLELGTVQHKGGKRVHAWAVQGDLDETAIRSNTFSLEWPPKSGKQREFPEVDRAAFFELAEAHRKMHTAEAEFLGRLLTRLA